jgi:hypothetical protein
MFKYQKRKALYLALSYQRLENSQFSCRYYLEPVHKVGKNYLYAMCLFRKFHLQGL